MLHRLYKAVNISIQIKEGESLPLRLSQASLSQPTPSAGFEDCDIQVYALSPQRPDSGYVLCTLYVVAIRPPALTWAHGMMVVLQAMGLRDIDFLPVP